MDLSPLALLLISFGWILAGYVRLNSFKNFLSRKQILAFNIVAMAFNLGGMMICLKHVFWK